MNSKRWLLALTLVSFTVGLAHVTTQEIAGGRKPILYLVATAHLDTQWNWTVQDTIRQFIPNTFHTNFKYIDQYPHYTFNYEGAIHYMWFKEYHPDEWATLQKHVASGRWRLAGSWINAVDTNMPSPESLMRQALYGKRFFRQEFGKVSNDIYLPDCFGFGFALPSIAAHSGLSAFSTQKLTWGRPIPFSVGRWKGVDGSEVVAALDPKSYNSRLTTDISVDPTWTQAVTSTGDGAAPVELRYFGTGDIGGAPVEESVQNLEKSIANPKGQLDIRNTAADQLSRDLTSTQKAALPGYEGELILKTHGTGCYTSQAAMKMFNRQNELLADDAERAAVTAEWLTGQSYPGERLRGAWIRFLWHQFHDDMTGTCIPQAYQFSWNDELSALNQFGGVLTSATSAVASVLDTQGSGTPLVVYNPVSLARRDPVEATVRFAGPAPAAVRVTDAATGHEVLAQVLSHSGNQAQIVFLAEVPSIGYKVFHVSAAPAAPAASATSAAAAARGSSLRASTSSLENNRLAVKIDQNGDIASIYDKDAKHELLHAPVMLELRDDPSAQWPAWELQYDVVQAPAREYLANPTVTILERGPVRIALEITRKSGGSTFVQRVRLTEGGDRVDVENLVDWKSPNSLLKASFPFAASNPKATYDLGLGTIDRTNNEPDKYEVPAQKWADVTDSGNTFGVGVINDSKYGWDKPNDNTLRLTLLHTPKPAQGYTYQSSNDLGHHRFVYAIAGHAGDWRQGRLPARASQLNQPLVAFQTESHPGALGRAFSMVTLDSLSGQVAVVALKKAEDSDEIVLRLQERHGQAARTTVRLPAGVTAVREINAAEEEVGPFAQPTPGGPGGGPGGGGGGQRGGLAAAGPRPLLVVDLKPYQPRTLALKLEAPTVGASATAPLRLPNFGFGGGPGGGPGGPGGPAGAQAPPQPPPPTPLTAPARHSTPLTLPFNLDGISTDADRGDGDFDGRKHTLAGELLPAELTLDGVLFKLGSSAAGAKNVLVPAGNQLTLPAPASGQQERYNRLYILASAVGGDVPATIGIGAAGASASGAAGAKIVIREWEGAIGQWDSRLKSPAALREPFVPASPRGTPSQDEIREGLVVQWDAATGEVHGIDQIRRAFVKRDEIAWIGTHRHTPDGNQPYVASYLFAYAIDLPAGTRTVTLPNSDRLRILAITAVHEPPRARPAMPLYAPTIADPN
jgi:alpha-mannosidase